MVRKRKEPTGAKERRHLNDLLDEGLKGTFPASDPVAVGQFTSTEPPSRPIARGTTDVSSKAGRVVAMQFTVGLKVNGKTEHTVVDAEDALIAALKVKMQRPDAEILYLRRANKRGDARHPVRALKKER